MQLIEADKCFRYDPCIDRITKILETTNWSPEKIHVLELVCKYLSSPRTGFSLETNLSNSLWGDPSAEITLTLRGDVPCSLLR